MTTQNINQEIKLGRKIQIIIKKSLTKHT